MNNLNINQFNQKVTPENLLISYSISDEIYICSAINSGKCYHVVTQKNTLRKFKSLNAIIEAIDCLKAGTQSEFRLSIIQ